MTRDEIIAQITALAREADVWPVKYRCSKCGGMHHRDSNKKWVKSWCEKTNQWSRLMRVEKKQQEKNT
jgi:hypothetical protein